MGEKEGKTRRRQACMVGDGVVHGMVEGRQDKKKASNAEINK